jgi:hypothetical protein
MSEIFAGVGIAMIVYAIVASIFNRELATTYSLIAIACTLVSERLRKK